VKAIQLRFLAVFKPGFATGHGHTILTHGIEFMYDTDGNWGGSQVEELNADEIRYYATLI